MVKSPRKCGRWREIKRSSSPEGLPCGGVGGGVGGGLGGGMGGGVGGGVGIGVLGVHSLSAYTLSGMRPPLFEIVKGDGLR